ncbi:hypothetical protein G6F37_006060 [Rhizopus arrhizus]|nr:hypothetical protein G6F37_006060 [Rhizopus arrhizus]
MQKEFMSHLRSLSLNIDILCLQEISSFRSQDHLTSDQIRYISTFMFPRCSVVVSKHCAIISLKPAYDLTDSSISLDERSVFATVRDTQGHLICNIANVYAPAQRADRLSFFDSFLSLPFVAKVQDDPWFLVGDFNLSIWKLSTVAHPRVRPWYDWTRQFFHNCATDQSHTFIRGKVRSTIDYIFATRSLSSYVTSTQLHYLPAEWTDHCLLTVDFFRDRTDLGPGVWRFNPTLLLDESFLTLLDVTTDLFFDESTSLSRLSSQEQWESFKQVLKCTAKKYSKSTKARTQHTVSKLQKERQCLSAQISGASQPSPSQTNEIHRLEKLIDKRTRQETCQQMLRSATRWLDKGEQNNKYFYRVIKERQIQQTIQRLRCSTTGDILESNSDLLREATSFYQRLYTPDTIDTTAVEDLLAHIPSDNMLSADQAQHLLAEPTNSDLVSLLEHTPHGKSPGLDGIPFEVYS